jgi:hypothetical protein
MKFVVMCSILLLTPNLITAQQFELKKMGSDYFESNSEFSKTNLDQTRLVTDFTFPNPIPIWEASVDLYNSVPIQLADGKVIVAILSGNRIGITSSTDGGLNWSSFTTIVNIGSISPGLKSLTGLRTQTGRVILVSSGLENDIYPYITFTDDNAVSWSVPKILLGGITASYVSYGKLTQTSDGTIWFIYNRLSGAGDNNINYRTSTDNGSTWSREQTFLSTSFNEESGTLISVSPTKLLSVHSDNSSGNYDIFQRTSIDNGLTWSEKTSIVNSPLKEKPLQLLKRSDGSLYLLYQVLKPTRFSEHFQNDICYTISTNQGETWSAPIEFTRFIGDDMNADACLVNDEPFITFSSKRTIISNKNHLHIWYGKLGITMDSKPPPLLIKSERTPFYYNQKIWIKAYVDDESGISSVKMRFAESDVEMFDDGMHNDGSAGDYIFAGSVGPFQIPQDSLQRFIDVNKLQIPFSYDGVIADVERITSPLLNYYFNVVDLDSNSINIGNERISYPHGGSYDGIEFLYSGGFLMSGYYGNTLWANGVSTSSRILDYQAGKVGSSVNDVLNKLYVVRSSDPPFGISWQNWIHAVALGADFYDGDNDGIYSPIDKNANGSWDPNEDKPDLLGDMTIWCVYNDGVPSSGKRFPQVPPLGIEIKQTVFAYASNTAPKGNIVFVKYEIENRGTVHSLLDSVYFVLWADPDLGEYTDDFAGCDTLLNSSFMYNEFDDKEFGSNPPSMFLQLLQSPPQYIPGITFIDLNSNGIYDSGIDTPRDTAYNYRGKYLGIEKFPGARNFNMTSAVPYMRSLPHVGIPTSVNAIRFYSLGKYSDGRTINPCTFGYGKVFGVNCAAVNPQFRFSGDPVTNYGWLCDYALDYHITSNLGPFQLLQNKPVTIIAAYIVGRGNSALNSITEARSIAKYSKSVYDGNFSLPTSVEDKVQTLPNEFKLYQNYPNPFNPSTVISFQLSAASHVTLKVYDILGREVATLVDEVKESGTHHYPFSIIHYPLPAGVYFYQLRVGSFVETKKMILLR